MEANKERLPLSDVQQKTVSMRIAALRADFPVKTLHIVMEDGTEWKVGVPVLQGDPVDVIMARLTQLGLGQADLAGMLGRRPRTTEILKRQRALTLAQIRAVSAGLGIPADALIGPIMEEGGHAELPGRARRVIPGYQRGTLKRLVEPWLELAVSSPGERLTIRPSDFKDMAFDRILGSLAAAAVNQFGRGCLRVWQEGDELEGRVAHVVFTQQGQDGLAPSNRGRADGSFTEVPNRRARQ